MLSPEKIALAYKMLTISYVNKDPAKLSNVRR